MTPTIGTVLNLSPATGSVRFAFPDGTTLTLPLIGYGVVVRHVDGDDSEYETQVEPLVVFEDCFPTSALALLREDFPGGTRARVVPDRCATCDDLTMGKTP
ncbi:hypothetical protein [Janibacter sp. G1551]|uniref:hypothetical protein n=1 Tax=Janibacter sp. G1551 TaxID=3420440 RepID=UPI003CFEC221